MIKREEFLIRVNKIENCVNESYVNEEITIDKVASNDELKQINCDIPAELQEFFLTISRDICICFRFPKPLNEPFEEIFTGYFEFSIFGLEDFCAYSKSWLDSHNKDIHRYFPIMEVDTGDLIVYDRDNSKIIYLSHEDGEEKLLAENFWSFIEFCMKIGFIGNEDWQYELFLEDSSKIEEFNNLYWK